MVILYAVVTFVQAGRHRQFENDPVSFFPLSLKNGKTSFDRWVDLLSVYRNHPLFGRRVQVTVQFAGHELVARPGGDAHMQAEGGRLLRVEGDFDPAIVGVVRFLGDRKRGCPHFQFSGGFGIHGEVEVLVVMSVGHSLNLGKQAGHVAWATCGPEPRGSSGGAVIERVLSVCFQRVYVKEPVAFQVDRCEYVVQERNFGNVEVLGVLVS